MPPRTLVIGIPLPHATFDNYSFASAPSISEYTRLIVEMAAVSRVVEEITQGSVEHKTFAGQPVAHGPTTARAFGLADLLAMRAREANQFFGRGGIALCIAYPDAAHEGIAALPGWRRYSWLPDPEDFSYATHLLPGFGKTGAEVCDEAHPFASYVALYGSRMAFRAHVAGKPAGAPPLRIFGRSSGGVAVAFDVRVGSGRAVFVPPLRNPEDDRIAVAGTLFESFEQCEVQQAEQPTDSISKEAP